MPEQHYDHVCTETATIAMLNTKLDSLISDMAEIKKSLNGNGVPGIKTRLDRVEQVLGMVKWVVGVAALAAIGGVGSMIVVITKHAYGVK